MTAGRYVVVGVIREFLVTALEKELLININKRSLAMIKTVNVTINGRAYQEDVEPRLLLSHFLREVAGLTGTHVGLIFRLLTKCKSSVRMQTAR